MKKNVVLMLSSLMMMSCKPNPEIFKIIGPFNVMILDDDKIALGSFVENINEENFYISYKYDGYVVSELGFDGPYYMNPLGGEFYGYGEEIYAYCSKLYIPNTIEKYYTNYINRNETCPNLDKVFVSTKNISLSDMPFSFASYGYSWEKSRIIYVPDEYYDFFDDESAAFICENYFYSDNHMTCEDEISCTHKRVQRANTLFKLNFDISNSMYLNEYFYIDNYEYGSLITSVPPIPTREGYEFEGWYKEQECVNKWDFEVDRLPITEINSDGLPTFQETVLYANWVLK